MPSQRATEPGARSASAPLRGLLRRRLGGFAAVLRAVVARVVVALVAVLRAGAFVAVLRAGALVAALVALAAVAFLVAAVALVALAALCLAVFFGALRALGTRPLATISLKPEPGRNAGTEVLRTRTASPVRGLRAIRAARVRFSKTPKPVMDTLSPLATAAWTSARTASRAVPAVRLVPQTHGERFNKLGLVHDFPPIVRDSQRVFLRDAMPSDTNLQTSHRKNPLCRNTLGTWPQREVGSESNRRHSVPPVDRTIRSLPA